LYDYVEVPFDARGEIDLLLPLSFTLPTAAMPIAVMGPTLINRSYRQ
jgi:hypothetical protein